MIAHYETHESNPSVDKVVAIANALNVNIVELLGLNKKAEKNQDLQFDVRTFNKLKILNTLSRQDRLQIYRYTDYIINKQKDKSNNPG